MPRWSRRSLFTGAGAGLLALSACTGKRNATPLVRQIEFVPVADGDRYPLMLADWLQANPVAGVDVRVEPTFSPRLPPVDIAIIEADQLQALQAALQEPNEAGETPPSAPSGMKLLFEEVHVAPDTEPEGAPVTRWRAHVVHADLGFVSKGASASVKFPSRKDDYGGLQLFLSDDDAERFHALTTEHDGRRIAIALGERALSVPVVNEPIPGGEVMITPGGTTPGERAAEVELLFRDLTGT